MSSPASLRPATHVVDALLGLTSRPEDTPVLLLDGAKPKTARTLLQDVRALSLELQASPELSRGDAPVHAALLGNSPDFVKLWLASCTAGAVFAPLNYRWSAKECADALRTLGSSSLIHDAALAPLAKAAVALVPGATAIPLEDLLARAAYRRGLEATSPLALSLGQPGSDPRAYLRPRWAPRGVAVLCFTSGTTGAAKAAALTHEAIHFQSLAKLSIVGYCPTDRYLHTAPLCHVGGMSSCHANLLAGALQVFPRSPLKLDPPSLLRLIPAHSITSIIAVPASLSDMCRAAGSDTALPTLERILVGAGAMGKELAAATFRLAPRADILTAYGMTEAASSITFARIDRRTCRPIDPTGGAGAASDAGPAGQQVLPAGAPLPAAARPVGWPPPGIRVRVFPTGPMEGGGEGEVQVQGPNLMLGYLSAAGPGQGWTLYGRAGPQPEPGPAAITGDGWLRTGDLGLLRADGPGGRPQLYLLGRIKDVIKTGGENVNAGEVEDVLSRHVSCAECAVFGVPHPRLGEMVAAVVVLRRGAGGGKTEEERPGEAHRAALLEHCRASGLAGFKVPRVLHVTFSPLPRNGMGKVDKRVLREGLAAALQGAGGGPGGSGGVHP